jgi:RNA polymerase sigma-70 factor (ECF subfamily)
MSNVELNSIKGGSNNAELSKLYVAYYPKVVGYIKSKLGYNNADVEDLASDVFQKVLANYDTFDASKASFSTWLYMLVHNMVIDYYRKTSAQTTFSSLDDAAEKVYMQPEEADTCNEEQLQLLTMGMKALTERERDIIILHYYKDYKLSEVAEMMHLSYANIRVIESRCIQKLKKYLQTL